MKTKCLLVTILLALSFNLTAQTAKPKSEEYVLPWTYVVDFDSKINQQPYKLIMQFPSSYSKAGKDKKYPVVYILDAQYHYPLVSALHGNFNWDGTIEDVIKVGITWGGEAPNYETLRQNDFTPSFDPNRAPSGNAETFLKTLKEEIIPFVEQNYKAGGSRTITGSSLSGLFSLYALFNEPELFDRVIAISPSLWWGDRVINTSKQKFIKNGLKQPTRLFIARGEYELMMAHDIDGLGKELSALSMENLSIKHEVVPNAGHSGVNGEGFGHGIRFVFDKPDITLSEEQLQQYAGVYKSDSPMLPEINLVLKEGKLFTVDPQGGSLPLKAAAEDHLYLIEFGADVLFSDITQGKAQKATVQLPRAEIEFVRK